MSITSAGQLVRNFEHAAEQLKLAPIEASALGDPKSWVGTSVVRGFVDDPYMTIFGRMKSQPSEVDAAAGLSSNSRTWWQTGDRPAVAGPWYRGYKYEGGNSQWRSDGGTVTVGTHRPVHLDDMAEAQLDPRKVYRQAGHSFQDAIDAATREAGFNRVEGGNFAHNEYPATVAVQQAENGMHYITTLRDKHGAHVPMLPVRDSQKVQLVPVHPSVKAVVTATDLVNFSDEAVKHTPVAGARRYFESYLGGE